jgi:predicted  nucleic acid-binding Zn-ribbon protein
MGLKHIKLKSFSAYSLDEALLNVATAKEDLKAAEDRLAALDKSIDEAVKACEDARDEKVKANKEQYDGGHISKDEYEAVEASAKEACEKKVAAMKAQHEADMKHAKLVKELMEAKAEFEPHFTKWNDKVSEITDKIAEIKVEVPEEKKEEE